jgi:hypothetical protein
MTLELLARAVRQHAGGIITDEEFARWLSDSFAGDPDLSVTDANEVALLIPSAARGLVKRQIETALQPGYLRQAFAFGGRIRTKDQELEAARRETAREIKWAAALKPLLS